MNYRGSYRHLLRNAKAAPLGAIEIYNKPRFEYRDECFVILLLNAWELALKALLSRSGQSIFYPKRRKQPYRTLSCNDAMIAPEQLLPKELPPLPVRQDRLPHLPQGQVPRQSLTYPRTTRSWASAASAF
jgi:hypothetical protein